MSKVLFIGETWMKTITHVKGFDSFVTNHYEDCSNYISDALTTEGHTVTHIPAHGVGYNFPKTLEELQQYDAVLLSDIGSNTFLLTDNVFVRGSTQNNSLELLKDFVLEGGGLLMVGGYMSFSGIEAKANYQNTVLADVLPVKMIDKDDRVENSEGVIPTIVSNNHSVFQGIDNDTWPLFLGYNQLQSKDDCEVLAVIDDDVFIAVGEFSKGRSGVFASDCAPHWGTQEFVDWTYYSTFWGNLIDWLTRKI